MYWPIFAGDTLTAAIMGILPRLRYILITRSLLDLLEIDELKAKIETIICYTNKMKKTGMSKIIKDIEENLVLLKNKMDNGDKPKDENYRKIIEKCKKHTITNREKEILFKILEGKEYKQIAADFHISINTVDKHIQQLHKKFHVQSNIELILLLK